MDVRSQQASSNLVDKTGSPQYSVGATVIYGLHGHCTIQSIETKTIGGQAVSFYRLERIKGGIQQKDPRHTAILLPLQQAEKALREPMKADLAEKAREILASREYYFSVDDGWAKVLPQIEATIQEEGGLGLAKAHCYFFVMKKRLVVLPTDVTKTRDKVARVLMRELSELEGIPMTAMEEQVERLMQKKLLDS